MFSCWCICPPSRNDFSRPLSPRVTSKFILISSSHQDQGRLLFHLLFLSPRVPARLPLSFNGRIHATDFRLTCVVEGVAPIQPPYAQVYRLARTFQLSPIDKPLGPASKRKKGQKTKMVQAKRQLETSLSGLGAPTQSWQFHVDRIRARYNSGEHAAASFDASINRTPGTANTYRVSPFLLFLYAQTKAGTGRTRRNADTISLVSAILQNQGTCAPCPTYKRGRVKRAMKGIDSSYRISAVKL